MDQMSLLRGGTEMKKDFGKRGMNMAENNKRKCPSINSGMLDKLNNFVAPRTSLCLGNLGYQEFEELLKVVDVRRPCRSSGFAQQKVRGC